MNHKQKEFLILNLVKSPANWAVIFIVGQVLYANLLILSRLGTVQTSPEAWLLLALLFVGSAMTWATIVYRCALNLGKIIYKNQRLVKNV